MFLKRKIVVITALLIAICIIAVVTSVNHTSLPTSANLSQKPQIILDAGHGGFDGGAVANDGTIEKDINLKIAIALKDLLIQNGYEVIMTRNTDTSTDNADAYKTATRKKSDLSNRLKLMDSYPQAIFVSIHLNKFTTSAASGSQVFYSGNSPDSKQIGDLIQSSIIRLIQPQNKRVNKKATSSTYLLHNATIPAVLVECGFLSNNNDLQNLKNAEYQRNMAFSIFCGINEYFMITKEL